MSIFSPLEEGKSETTIPFSIGGNPFSNQFSTILAEYPENLWLTIEISD